MRTPSGAATECRVPSTEAPDDRRARTRSKTVTRRSPGTGSSHTSGTASREWLERPYFTATLRETLEALIGGTARTPVAEPRKAARDLSGLGRMLAGWANDHDGGQGGRRGRDEGTISRAGSGAGAVVKIGAGRQALAFMPADSCRCASAQRVIRVAGPLPR